MVLGLIGCRVQGPVALATALYSQKLQEANRKAPGQV